ncbi:hypothetical protein TNCV_3078881 [Trichonephila clavipes]|nr:hypothetical protein TNCV_3078881 [Trichonephila clavipes]
MFPTRGRAPPYVEHRIDTSDPPNSSVSLQNESRKKQDCQKENFDRRRRKYYKPGDKVWVTIHPISRNNRWQGNSSPRRSLTHTHLEITSSMRLPTRLTHTKPLELIIFLP